MKKSCTLDPDKTRKICSGQDNLSIELTRKATNKLKKIQKIYEKKDISEEKKLSISNIIQTGLNSKFVVGKDEIRGVLCTKNINNTFDQLLLLRTKENLNSNKYLNPIVPIVLKKGSCNTLMNSNFLKLHNYKSDVFLEMAKKEIGEMKNKSNVI